MILLGFLIGSISLVFLLTPNVCVDEELELFWYAWLTNKKIKKIEEMNYLLNIYPIYGFTYIIDYSLRLSKICNYDLIRFNSWN